MKYKQTLSSLQQTNLSYNNILLEFNIMAKPAFILEEAAFSDSDNETPLSGTVATQYHREYSLIYHEIKSFLKQCKENINKYIQLNQFGARFNMFALYAQMTTMETSTLTGLSDVSKQQLQNQKNLKITYQKEFQNILQRMEGVIRDFLKFQIDFKREYFGINIKEAQVIASKKRGHKKTAKSSIFQKLSRQNSIHSGSSDRRPSSRTFIEKTTQEQFENEQKQSELQQKLRQILKRKLAPQKQNIIKFCDKESDPFRNMLKLEQKIDMMQSEMILSKTREEKIIEIFNKRRIQNIQPKGHGLVHSQLIDTTDPGHEKNKGKGFSRTKTTESQFAQQIDKDGRKFVKPSLNIELINEKRQQSKLNTPNGKQTPRQLISPRCMKSPNSSRKVNGVNFLISPKHGISKKMEFHNNNNGGVGFRFKKKREQQEGKLGEREKKSIMLSQALESMVQRDKEEKESQINREQRIKRVRENKKIRQEVGRNGLIGQEEVHNNNHNNHNNNNPNFNPSAIHNQQQSNNNRQEFMKRRRSSNNNNNNNQNCYVGVWSLIE